MVRDTARRVTDHVLDQVGDELRTTAVLTPDDWEVVYLRDDLSEQYAPDEYEQALTAFRATTEVDQPAVETLPIGERRAVVHYHEHAFVLQFPYQPGKTVIVSVEPAVGSSLGSFIDECRELVDDA
ncbi:hypothetical protein [Halorientalis salina]|uniref:hypothetical protein n=1 Tax=Halorientalis salina TaxID=2932266 RepID=UPI0010ACAE7D|nr:hypothetical protein [Halorientalis salina]